MKYVSYKCTDELYGIWRVTIDGSILGDSRGYDRKKCRDEAIKMVADEERWSKRDGRPCEMVFIEV